jgi:DMSO reductase anchor subunit
MNPAYSVIFFTTASGAGYGLWVWLALRLMTGEPGGAMAVTALVLGGVLVTLGLLSSTFHLGHPERAWRAFSQWRSSWLSREGVAAVATYLPAGALFLAFLFPGALPGAGLFAALMVLGALATLWCTGMIYASLRTVPEWNHGLVPAIYIALAAATGASAGARGGRYLLTGLYPNSSMRSNPPRAATCRETSLSGSPRSPKARAPVGQARTQAGTRSSGAMVSL